MTTQSDQEPSRSQRRPSAYEIELESGLSAFPKAKHDHSSNVPIDATAKSPKALDLIFVIVALVMAMFLVALDMTIVATAIPRITDEFHSLDQVGWYGSGFFLTLAAFQSAWGKAYKYFPLKMTFMVSFAVFELGSLLCGAARNSAMLILGRTIAGMGGAGISSGAYTITAFAAPPEKRAALTGVLAISWGAASVIGPVMGGVFTTHATWRWCFYISIPIGALSVATLFFFFQTPADAKPVKANLCEKVLQMDPLGLMVLIAAIICFILPLQWGGGTKSWSDSSVVGTLCVFVLLLTLFAVIEKFMGDRTMLPGYLLGNRAILVNCLYVFFMAGSYYVMLYCLPIYFQSVDGDSASRSGVNNIPFVLSLALFSIVSGGLISTFGIYVPFLLFGSGITTIGALWIFTLNVNSKASHWIGYQIIFGIGIGLAVQVPIIANQAFVNMSEISSVSAITLFFQCIGGAFCVSATQSAFENRLLSRIPITAPLIDPKLVLATGAAELRHVFTATEIPGIIAAYMDGLKVTFALVIAFAAVTLPIALFAKWQNVKPKA